MPTTKQIVTAATMKAQDIPDAVIAREVGIPRTSLQRYLQKDEIQALIKDAQLKLISGSLTTAVKNQRLKIGLSHKILKLAGQDKALPDNAKTLLELGDRAESKLLESTGIHPSHTQSIQINNILVDARSELSPAIEAMLVNHLIAEGNQQDSAVIDVEAENIHDATD